MQDRHNMHELAETLEAEGRAIETITREQRELERLKRKLLNMIVEHRRRPNDRPLRELRVSFTEYMLAKSEHLLDEHDNLRGYGVKVVPS